MILLILARRVPVETFAAALAQADYRLFLAAMIANAIVLFCGDTWVLAMALRWFHRPMPYRELMAARASSYVVGCFSMNAGRGVLALYLKRRIGVRFLELGSTVLLLVLSEYVHLFGWATIGMARLWPHAALRLLWLVPALALAWRALVALRARASAARGWLRMATNTPVLRSFHLASARQLAQITLVRAPIFLVSLGLHYVGARAFGLDIPFISFVCFVPLIFMIAALPLTVAYVGTTQAAWVFLFGAYAPESRLLAFSVAAHITFLTTRAALGLLFLPRAYEDLVLSSPAAPPVTVSES